MKISGGERQAIADVLNAGATYGYGNLISHLQTAWAMSLIQEYGMEEAAARQAAGGPGYPFAMQYDIITTGQWDETGKRYSPQLKAQPKPAENAR